MGNSKIWTAFVGPVLLDKPRLISALSVADEVIALDGGAVQLQQCGVKPDLVAGDLDSLSAQSQNELGSKLLHLPDQNFHDFEKVLASFQPNHVLALGCLGDRLDHSLANLEVALRFSETEFVFVGTHDTCLLLRNRTRLRLRKDSRVSLFAPQNTTVTSRGLRWDLSDDVFGPGRAFSLSNRVQSEVITIETTAPVWLFAEPDLWGELMQAERCGSRV